MAATADQRLHPGHLLEGCRSVIVVAMSYHGSHPDSDAHPPDDRVWISRYAWGRDYHRILKKRLIRLGRELEDAAPGLRLARRRRHRAVARARVGGPRRSRLDRQEHHAAQPPARLRAFPRRPPHRSRARTRHPRHRSLRPLHGLPRRLPDRRLPRNPISSTPGAASATSPWSTAARSTPNSPPPWVRWSPAAIAATRSARGQKGPPPISTPSSPRPRIDTVRSSPISKPSTRRVGSSGGRAVRSGESPSNSSGEASRWRGPTSNGGKLNDQAQ